MALTRETNLGTISVANLFFAQMIADSFKLENCKGRVWPATKKGKQIGILADMNGCSREKIREVLRRNGISEAELPGKPGRKPTAEETEIFKFGDTVEVYAKIFSSSINSHNTIYAFCLYLLVRQKLVILRILLEQSKALLRAAWL